MNNYYRFSLNVTDKDITLPIELNFDFEGREQAIEEFEKDAVKQVINDIDDFETTKFAHAPYGVNNSKTEINYQFNFFNYQAQTNFTTNPPTISDLLDDYEYATFNDNEIFYFANSFKGSFFKLDFYDNTIPENQKILFSVILPTQQGLKEPGFIGPLLNQSPVFVKKPKFVLDYVGQDKEGFFFYWLKERGYLDISVFYMSAKFFNAKIGQFVRMMNVPQSSLIGSQYDFNKEDYFYYKVNFDYNNYEYSVYRGLSNVRVGVGQNPDESIIWYEYVNP